MKRIVVLCSILAVISYVSAQNYDIESKWSIEAKAGLNYYRLADDSPSQSNNFGTYFKRISYQAPIVRVRYSLNKYYDIGAGLGHYSYSRNRLNGHSYELDLAFSANLTELTSKPSKMDYKKWNWFASLGAGVSNYYYDLYALDISGSGFTPVANAAISLEYRLNMSWSLIGEGLFKQYFINDLSGLSKSFYNQAVLLSFGIRYRISSGECNCDK